MSHDEQLPGGASRASNSVIRAAVIKRAAPTTDPRTGREVGNMVLEERIGSGGMGDVFKAHHRTLKTPFAIKVLHPRFSQDPDTVERFRREAVACSKLRHENVVFVTDFGFHSDVGIFITMEHLEGLTLKQTLKRDGPFSIGRMGHVGLQLARAVGCAHRLDIVHRDLKPENIMLIDRPGRPELVKVLDFGIAFMRDLEAQEALGGKGLVLGTPSYMAPEQVLDKPEFIGAHTDIYALGLMFYTMLTGAPPFVGDDDLEVLKLQVNAAPRPLHELLPALRNSSLAELIDRMLDKAISRRPNNLEDLEIELEDALLELQVRGVRGAIYSPPSAHVSDGPTRPVLTGAVSKSIHMTNVISQIRGIAPHSPAGSLLSAMPNLQAVGGEAMCLALWGVLQQQLMVAPVSSPEFQTATEQLSLLVQAVLESHDGSARSGSQDRVFAMLGTVMTLLDLDRRRRALGALRPMSSHPLFPPELDADELSGNWESFKEAMNRPIRIPWTRTNDPSVEPKALEDLGPESVEPESLDSEYLDPEDLDTVTPEDDPTPEEQERRGLLEKLRQDVSLRSIGAVLTHKIQVRGKGED